MSPYLSLITAHAPQRRYPLREVFNALRWFVQPGAPWCYLPGDRPPWPAVYQQTRRWLAAGCFEAMVHDLWEVLRWLRGRADLDVIKVVPVGGQDGCLLLQVRGPTLYSGHGVVRGRVSKRRAPAGLSGCTNRRARCTDQHDGLRLVWTSGKAA